MITTEIRVALAEYLKLCVIHARALERLDVTDRESIVQCRLMTGNLTEAGRALLDTLLARIRTQTH